jgi:hypothetical protein
MLNETHEVLRMLAGIDPEHLARILRHIRGFADDALTGKDASGRFRLDDLVPIADVIAYVAELVDWSNSRDAFPEQWAELQRGDR